ncbi:hypothetical protein JR338_00820 [Chloroflexota bacterium]|nr:hypothetical protein JR338_00820 [Chloroflexota bacterium]
MTENPIFQPSIISKIRSAEEAEIIQPIEVGTTNAENELVFFIKPELLEVQDDAKIENSLHLIQKKFEEYEVTISGAAIVPGAILEQYEIMNRHYGFINQLSRFASTLIDGETRQAMFAKLGIKDTGDHKILGGHEFLTNFNTDLDTLSDVWFGKGAEKMRSGFYFVEETFQGQPILLVNGFHPSQLAHFTRSDHRIVLMLLHTNTDWERMKFSLVGDTFPERAIPDSIRGMLHADPEKYGQAEVGINTNGVHLSAGPYEAAYEVVNFFGNLLNLDPAITPPAAIQRSIDAGVPRDLAFKLLENPEVDDSDLFSETENMDTKDAIHFVLDNPV